MSLGNIFFNCFVFDICWDVSAYNSGCIFSHPNNVFLEYIIYLIIAPDFCSCLHYYIVSHLSVLLYLIFYTFCLSLTWSP